MTDELRKRRHDHIVEPVFAALRHGEAEAQPGGARPGRRSARGWRLVLTVALIAGIVGAALFALLQ